MAYNPVHANSPHRVVGRSHAFDHDGFDFASATATKGGGLVVFRRFEAGDALLEGRKFDHYETTEFVRAFHDLKTSAAGQYLAAKLCENVGHKVSVLLVFDRIVDF